MNNQVNLKSAAVKIRIILFILFIAYTTLHYYVFHFSDEAYSAIVGTLIIGVIIVEIFYKKLLEGTKNQNLYKQLKITMSIFFGLFIALHYTVVHFQYDVLSAVVGTMIVVWVIIEMSYKKAYETFQKENINN